jgi:hypothetical protein
MGATILPASAGFSAAQEAVSLLATDRQQGRRS